MKNITTKVYDRNIINSAGRATRNTGPSRHIPIKRKSQSALVSSPQTLFNTATIPRICRRSQDESLDHIRTARVSWEQGILEELRAIIYESRRPFLIIRYHRAFLLSKILIQMTHTSENMILSTENLAVPLPGSMRRLRRPWRQSLKPTPLRWVKMGLPSVPIPPQESPTEKA